MREHFPITPSSRDRLGMEWLLHLQADAVSQCLVCSKGRAAHGYNNQTTPPPKPSPHPYTLPSSFYSLHTGRQLACHLTSLPTVHNNWTVAGELRNKQPEPEDEKRALMK
ncbi:hypothetical protein C0Q70_09763 [Pomacea canaliculata]|uniref:Uncharacterized protein n=1 Tax=Pomacea canaliculata TaxID=400727 RepID=A0A2T7PAQ9_POMCA|nr:hypothetical protein C0Q70_09763 [Pomacea canaliculata]